MGTKNWQLTDAPGHHPWQTHVQAVGRSGPSRAEDCRRGGIFCHTLTYWCRRLARTDGNQESRRVAAAVVHDPGRTHVQRGSAPLRITCLPLRDLLQEEDLAGSWIHADETTLQGQKEPGRKPTSRSCMWILPRGGPDRQLLIYQYHPTRSGDVARSGVR